jgi:uncharacterized phage protein gp47/JayE
MDDLFSTPPLKELIRQAQADMQGELKLTVPLRRRSFLRAMALAQAGLAFMMFGFLRRFVENALPWSAKGVWLLKWASWWNGMAPKAADYAVGNVDIAGANGAILPQDTLLRARTGQTFVTQADATIVAGVATVQVKASEAGTASNLDAGTALSLVMPETGINSNATVSAAGIANGTDAEDLEDFRARWDRYRQRRGNGSALTDYEERALEVPGVTRAWAFDDRDGAGTVAVFFVRDNDVNIIPNAAAVAAVQAHLTDRSWKPAGGTVTTYAPVPVPFNLTIKLRPNSVAVQNKVKAEVDDLIKREADLAATIELSRVSEAVSLAEGETAHKLVDPADEPVVLSNQILVPGAITWEPY